VLFAVARDEAGTAVGCGAIVMETGYGELKRMYVRPEQPRTRRCGQGAGLSRRRSDVARLHAMFRLETGVSQPEALSFYARAGYERRGPFGSYGPDPFSVFRASPTPTACSAPRMSPASLLLYFAAQSTPST
jgi:putative acetyltransferase